MRCPQAHTHLSHRLWFTHPPSMSYPKESCIRLSGIFSRPQRLIACLLHRKGCKTTTTTRPLGAETPPSPVQGPVLIPRAPSGQSESIQSGSQDDKCARAPSRDGGAPTVPAIPQHVFVAAHRQTTRAAVPCAPPPFGLQGGILGGQSSASRDWVGPFDKLQSPATWLPSAADGCAKQLPRRAYLGLGPKPGAS